MTTWFTSDTHYYHHNIIGFCDRDIGYGPGHVPAFMSREEANNRMNQILIERYNAVVKPEDEVYHLGDFAFCGVNKADAILEQLNGKKYWIKGNHDYQLADNDKINSHFVWVRDYTRKMFKMEYQDDEGQDQSYFQPIVMCHFPIASWDAMSHGSWHLHGHCHGSLEDIGVCRIDVGVDCHGLAPVSLDKLRNIMALRSIKSVDHHGAVKRERVSYV